MATVSYNDAKQLTTGSEFKIVQVSMDQRAGKMSADRVKDLISLVRNLRDKAISNLRQQRREQRGKSAPRGKTPAGDSERSHQKVQLFIETLARLKTKASAIAKRDKEAAKSKSSASAKTKTLKKSTAKQSGKATTKTKAKAKAPAKPADSASKSSRKQPPLKEIVTAPKKSVGVATLAKAGDSVQGRVKINREQNRMALGGTKRIQGHISGQTRRNQGKRDAKAAAARR